MGRIARQSGDRGLGERLSGRNEVDHLFAPGIVDAISFDESFQDDVETRYRLAFFEKNLVFFQHPSFGIPGDLQEIGFGKSVKNRSLAQSRSKCGTLDDIERGHGNGMSF